MDRQACEPLRQRHTDHDLRSLRLYDCGARQRFVRRGGFLFGEDWVVKEVIEKAFPRYVMAGEVLRSAVIDSVDVVPARGMATHPYLRGIFVAEKVEVVDDDDGEDDDDDDDEGTTVVKKPKKEGKGSGGKLVRLKHRWAIEQEGRLADSVGSILRPGARCGDGQAGVEDRAGPVTDFARHACDMDARRQGTGR